MASLLSFGASAGAQSSDLQTSDVQDRSCGNDKRAKG
jgi:hypothetical protein